MTDEKTGAAPAPRPEPPDEPLTLLYLDVDDEITSAAARIRAAGADEVALVLPYGSRLATSRINFRLLAREARERGKRIEVICADASARALAAAAGLTVHPSVAAFEARRSGADATLGDGSADATGAAAGSGARAGETSGRATGVGARIGAAMGAAGGAASGALPGAGGASGHDAALDPSDTRTSVLPVPRRKAPKVPLVGPARPPMRTGVAIGLGVAAIVAVIVGGLLALEYLPSADITLNPRSEELGPFDLTVEAREDAAVPDPANLVIPARRFPFALESTQTFPATGVKVTDIKATGKVRFSNFDTGSANRIDAGSVVETDSGVRFETLATVTLPNATIQFPFTIVPSTSTVDIEAVEAGPDGNVGNNTITIIRGENRRLLQVTNVEATTGGAHEESPQVSEDDVEGARAALAAALVTELDRQVTERVGVPEAVTLFAQTRLVGETRWSVEPESLVGTEATEFSLGAAADGTALGVDPAPIAAVADARLRSRMTAGWTLLPDSTALGIGAPTVIGEVISYPVEIGATQVRDVDENAILAEIRGMLLSEARSRLDDYGDVAISVWPEWVTTIPTREDRVTLTLGQPQPAPSPSP